MTEPTKLHFWQRTRGSMLDEIHNPRPYARLDDGQLVEFHACGPDKAEMEAVFREGNFRWKYLGTGCLYTIDGTVQFPKPQRSLAK